MSAKALPTLDFWYDFASSYSHPAAMTIARRAADAGVEVRWRPFLLGAILNRQRGLTDIPFAGHDEKAALAVEAEGLSIAAFSRAVFDANFARDQDIGDVGRLGEILAEIDMPGAAVMQRAQTPEIKDALKAQTEEAHTLGVFGAPTFSTPDGELFWGFDHMDEALKWAASPPQET